MFATVLYIVCSISQSVHSTDNTRRSTERFIFTRLYYYNRFRIMRSKRINVRGRGYLSSRIYYRIKNLTCMYDGLLYWIIYTDYIHQARAGNIYIYIYILHDVHLYANEIIAKGHVRNTFSGSSVRCIGSR